MADIKLKLKKTDGTDLTLPNAYIDSITSTSQSTTNPSTIQYGILSNSGSAEIRDIDGIIKKNIISGYISGRNIQTKLFFNLKQIQEHLSTDNTYESTDTMLSMQFSDNLYKLKQVQINKFIEKGYTGNKISFYNLISSALNNSNFDKIFTITIDEFLSKLTSNNVIVSNQEITIENYLKNIIIEDGTAFIRQDSIYNFLDKIAIAAQLNLLQFDNGDIKFISSRPIFMGTSKIIHIPNIAKASELETDLFIKNKIDKLLIKQNKITSNYQDVVNANISLQINDVVSLSNLDKGQIIESDNRYYLCFFYTVNTSDTILTNTIYQIDNVYSSSTMVHDTSGGIGASIADFYFTSGNKENFNFQEYLGGVELLYELSTETSITLAFSIDITDLDRNNLQNVEISIRPRSIQSNREIVNYSTNLSSENYYNFEFDNEYLSTSVKYYTNNVGTLFYNIIANNILTDYSQGISIGNIEVFCTDLKYQNGTIAKNYDNGDILNINDIIYFDNDFDNNSNQRYWRIVGRTFDFNGSTKLSLELQQAKLITT